MAQGLDQAAPTLADTPVAFAHFLRDLANDNGFSAAYLIDREGRVLARADSPGISSLSCAASIDVCRRLMKAMVSVGPFESLDLFPRPLPSAHGYPDAYLYVVRPPRSRDFPPPP